jgi:hypothetical protein
MKMVEAVRGAMVMRTAPVRTAHPRSIDAIDETERRARRGHRPPVPPNRPWGVFCLVAVLFIVIVVVIAERGTIPGGSGVAHRPSYVIVPAGDDWQLSPAQFHAVRFSTTDNATLFGNFTSLNSPVNVLLMNSSEYSSFVNNTTQPASLDATDGVYLGGVDGWTLVPPGVFWLVAWNYDPHHATTVSWVSSVMWLEAAPSK